MSDLPFRVGHGYDLHQLQAGGRLLLAGIEVSTDISPIAHSDGDVVLHAAVDALLGAIGAGDIGEHFPNTDPQWRNAPSARFIEHALKLVHERGYVVGNVDALVIAERPRLKPHKAALRASLAQLLNVAPEQVNIKAGTNEGCDAIGRGEAIAADVTLLLIRK